MQEIQIEVKCTSKEVNKAVSFWALRLRTVSIVGVTSICLHALLTRYC